ADALSLAALLLQLEGTRIGQGTEPIGPDERLVDAAEPAAVGGVDGSAQGHRLAVHRSPGRDDEIGESDEALRLDGVVRDDQRGQGEAPDVLALLLGTRQNHGVDTRVRPDPREDLREQGIRLAVIERDIRRWAHDDHHALSVDAHLLERVGVYLEVGEIVLLLETRISEQLLRPDAESLQP